MKKGDLELQTVGLIIFAVVLLVVIIFFVIGGKDKLGLLVEKLKEIFTFS